MIISQFQKILLVVLVSLVLGKGVPTNKEIDSVNNDIIILSTNELPCYSCLDSTSKSPECLCEGAKCLIKAKNSNVTKVTDRRCTDERWVYELLYDGCLTYSNQYWCVCSSTFCNGGDIQSIRGNDDCSKNPCPSGSLCLDTYDGFRCMCPPWQPSCTYSMPANCPCQNGGICVQLPTGNLGCSCRYGYTGERCEIKNLSWICEDNIKKCNEKAGSYCIKYGSEYECRCENGYFGIDCEYSVYEENTDLSVEITDPVINHTTSVPIDFNKLINDNILDELTNNDQYGEDNDDDDDDKIIEDPVSVMFETINKNRKIENIDNNDKLDEMIKHEKYNENNNNNNNDYEFINSVEKIDHNNKFNTYKLDPFESIGDLIRSEDNNPEEIGNDDYDELTTTKKKRKPTRPNIIVKTTTPVLIEELREVHLENNHNENENENENENNENNDDGILMTVPERIDELMNVIPVTFPKINSKPRKTTTTTAAKNLRKTSKKTYPRFNPCNPNPCNSGKCISVRGGYRCRCPPGVSGKKCQLTSNGMCPFANPCLNGGVCIDSEPAFKCICHAENYGAFCEKRINECVFKNPCKNGATCLFKNNTASCKCPSSFSGKFCEKNICEIASPCQNNGVCMTTVENEFKCSCMPGYEGTFCEKVRFFLGCPPVNPCLNNGTCVENKFGFKCECGKDFGGNRCQYDKTKITKSTLAATTSTIPKNRCIISKIECLNKGICIDTINGIKCQCLPQYTGRKCELEVKLKTKSSQQNTLSILKSKYTNNTQFNSNITNLTSSSSTSSTSSLLSLAPTTSSKSSSFISPINSTPFDFELFFQNLTNFDFDVY